MIGKTYMKTESTKTQEKKLETLEEAAMTVLNEDLGKFNLNDEKRETKGGFEIYVWAIFLSKLMAYVRGDARPDSDIGKELYRIQMRMRDVEERPDMYGVSRSDRYKLMPAFRDLARMVSERIKEEISKQRLGATDDPGKLQEPKTFVTKGVTPDTSMAGRRLGDYVGDAF